MKIKRRDFLAQASSVAGLTLMPNAGAQQTPCPPPGLDEGTSRRCPAGDAEADWQERISQPGVVWHHDFRSDAEVDAFRWRNGYGNDPNQVDSAGRCIRNASDGITGGGCLELIYPVPGGGNVGWWRPFGPMSAASSGKAVDDPAANGTMPLVPWDARNRGENEAYRRSYYAHPSYIGADGYSADQFDGSEFWLQFRIKIDPNRYASNTPSAGKLSFLATTQRTLNQEIVSQNMRGREASWYTNFGSSPDTGGSMGSGVAYAKQPGGDYDSCRTNTGAGCWLYNGGEWVTWLYHLVPGTHNNRDTLFEAFVAREGQTTYETVFTQQNTIRYSSGVGHPFGYNSFQPSNYMNGQQTGTEWYQRYDQIVFSKEFIACPQV